MKKLNPVVESIGSPMSFDEVVGFSARYLNKILGKNTEVVYLMITGVFGRTSNTHCAPCNGVTNWRSKPDKPRGYPGWTGKVWVAFSNDHYTKRNSCWWSHSGLSECCIHGGTGGGGHYNYPFHDCILPNKRPPMKQSGFSLDMFEQDWPSLALSNLIMPFDNYKNMSGSYVNKNYFTPIFKAAIPWGKQ